MLSNKADLHIHTKYSFDVEKDGSGEPELIAETAIARGLDTIALCDHCDIDGVLDGIYDPYEQDILVPDILKIKEKYAGKLDIKLGIELGQAHARPDEARKMLDGAPYEFILGSLHNLRDYPDFFLLKFEMFTPEHIDLLVRRSITQQCEIANFTWRGRHIDSLAHITYIGRYLHMAGVDFDFLRYEKEWRALFHMLIENGIALEINASGLRKDYRTMPGEELIALYKDCGGKRFTLGSDAHAACDVGMGVAEAFALATK